MPRHAKMLYQLTQSDCLGLSGYPILLDLSDNEDQYKIPSCKKQKELIYITNKYIDIAIIDIRADIRAIGSELGRKINKVITKFDIIIRRINSIDNKIDFLTEN